MRDILSKSKTGLVDDSNSSTGRTENEKARLLALVTDDICSAILETSFTRMLKKENAYAEMTPTVGTLELWSNEFDSKIDFSNYRSRLVCRWPDYCSFLSSHHVMFLLFFNTNCTAEVISISNLFDDYLYCMKCLEMVCTEK